MPSIWRFAPQLGFDLRKYAEHSGTYQAANRFGGKIFVGLRGRCAKAEYRFLLQAL